MNVVSLTHVKQKGLWIGVPDDRQLLDTVRLGAAMWHESSVYGHMEQDVDLMIEHAYNVRADQESSFLNVAVLDGETVGFFTGGLSPYGFHRQTFAYDRLFFVTPDKRGGRAARALITAFEVWARQRGAARILLGITTGTRTDATEKFYNKMGYNTVGVLTMKEL